MPIALIISERLLRTGVESPSSCQGATRSSGCVGVPLVGLVMDLLGGMSLTKGFEIFLVPICGGDIEEPLVDPPVESEPALVPEVEPDVDGDTRVVGKGGRGHAGRFITIEGVSRKLCPGEGGDFIVFALIVLCPVVAVTVAGVAVADDRDDSKAAVSWVAVAAGCVGGGGIGIERVGLVGLVRIVCEGVVSADADADLDDDVDTADVVDGVWPCRTSGAGAAGSVEDLRCSGVLSGRTTAPFAPAGGIPPIPVSVPS